MADGNGERPTIRRREMSRTHRDYDLDEQPVSVVMDLIAQLGIKDGVTPLVGPYERVLDEHWTLCLNPDTEMYKWRGFEIPRFHCAIEFNGWPAGLINPFAGWIAAGTVANEDALIEALRLALATPCS